MLRTALLTLFLLTACAASPAREKGGLVPLAGVEAERVEAAARPRRVALVVGIDAVADPYWPALKWAGKDARDVARVLESAGGFDRVVVLDTPAATGRDRILAEVARLGRAAPRPEDTVVVYLSGHGTLAPAGTRLARVMVTADTRRANLLESGLLVDDLLAAFEQLPSRRKLLVLATCHSGSGKSLLTPEVARLSSALKGPSPTLESVSRASLVLSAADLGQPAREDDRLRNDVYTHFLIEALEDGADANGDGAVTATEAHDYARRRTFEYTGGAQVPVAESFVRGTDPLVLAGRRRAAGLPVLYSYAGTLDGWEVRAEGRTKGSLPGNVVLEPGTHDISVTRGGRSVYRGRVSLRPGQRVAVESLLQEAEPRVAASVGYGFFSLIDDGLAGGVLRPLGIATARLRWRDLPAPGLDAVLDVGAGWADQTVRSGDLPLPQRVRVLRIGLGATWTADLERLRLHVGPQLGWLQVARGIGTEDLREAQAFGTLTPGLMGGVSVPVGRLELTVTGRANYLPLILDGELRSVFTAAVDTGVGVRF